MGLKSFVIRDKIQQKHLKLSLTIYFFLLSSQKVPVHIHPQPKRVKKCNNLTNTSDYEI